MTTDRLLVRAYGALIKLYPRRFRDEHGTDMIQLIREACDDETTARLCWLIITDLTLSIPTQHLEAHVHRTPTHLVPLLYTATAGAGVVLALAGGTNIALLVIGVLVAVAAGTASVVTWRRAAPIGGLIETRLWWKFLVAGPLLIGAVIVGAALGIEAWEVGMIAVFLGIILTGTGLLLGLVRLTTRPPHVLPS